MLSGLHSPQSLPLTLYQNLKGGSPLRSLLLLKPLKGSFLHLSPPISSSQKVGYGIETLSPHALKIKILEMNASPLHSPTPDTAQPSNPSQCRLWKSPPAPAMTLDPRQVLPSSWDMYGWHIQDLSLSEISHLEEPSHQILLKYLFPELS